MSRLMRSVNSRNFFRRCLSCPLLLLQLFQIPVPNPFFLGLDLVHLRETRQVFRDLCRNLSSTFAPARIVLTVPSFLHQPKPLKYRKLSKNRHRQKQRK
jgi:hypothetical protein